MSKLNSLYHLLDKTVLSFPTRPLFHLNSTSFVSYDTFMKDVGNFRLLLNQHNVKKSDNVVIIGNNTERWASLAYATWAEGAVVVPMYEKQNLEVKKHVIRETNPKIIFNTGQSVTDGQNSFVNKPQINHTTIVLQKSQPVNMFDEPDIQLDDLATILYTSGTTGLPKGVKLTHFNIISNMESINKISSRLPITEQDKYVSFLPWSHCYGLNCELNYLIWKGASTHINSNLLELRTDLVRHNPTVLCAVPKLFHEIHKKIGKVSVFPGFVKKFVKNKTFGENMRFATVGGASINTSLLHFYNDIGLPIYQGYGITECSPLISLNSAYDNKVGSVGKVLDCNDVKIVDGEILVGGSNVTSGYCLNRSTDSFEMIDGKQYFKTGDNGHIDGAGYLHITGRIKESYKLSNGKFVNPDEIELAIMGSVPDIKQVMIYSKDGDEFNSAIVVSDLPEYKVRQKIEKLGIDKYKVPKVIKVVSELFTIDNDLVTPKQSLKRNNIVKYFKL